MNWHIINKNIASISSAGQLFATQAGNSKVYAETNTCESNRCNVIVNSVEQPPTTNPGNKGGIDIRYMGTDYDPVSGMDSNSVSALQPGKDVPEVLQRTDDVDRNIWWINPQSIIFNAISDKYVDVKTQESSPEWHFHKLKIHLDICANKFFRKSR